MSEYVLFTTARSCWFCNTSQLMLPACKKCMHVSVRTRLVCRRRVIADILVVQRESKRRHCGCRLYAPIVLSFMLDTTATTMRQLKIYLNVIFTIMFSELRRLLLSSFYWCLLAAGWDQSWTVNMVRDVQCVNNLTQHNNTATRNVEINFQWKNTLCLRHSWTAV